MRRIYIFYILFFFIFPVKLLYAQVSFNAKVDKVNLPINETLIYEIDITTQSKNIPSPKLPKFEDFIVVSQQQSSNISFKKDKIATQIVYSFVLMPRRSGKLKIEPAEIKIENRTYYTEAFEIEVKEIEREPSHSDLPFPVEGEVVSL